MAIVVAKVELKSVMDASGMAACIKAGTFGADEVVAVIGTTSPASSPIRHSVACSLSSETAARPTSRAFPWCGRAVAMV